MPSLAAGALHWEKGLGNSAPSCPTALIVKLGAWVKAQCGWREGAEAAVGNSPELAGGTAWFQPGHGDNSPHARPDGVSGKRSGKGRRGVLTLSLPLLGTSASAAPPPRDGRQPPARGWVPPLRPHPASSSAFTAWKNEGTNVIRRAARNLENRAMQQKLEW